MAFRLKKNDEQSTPEEVVYDLFDVINLASDADGTIDARRVPAGTITEVALTTEVTGLLEQKKQAIKVHNAHVAELNSRLADMKAKLVELRRLERPGP